MQEVPSMSSAQPKAFQAIQFADRHLPYIERGHQTQVRLPIMFETRPPTPEPSDMRFLDADTEHDTQYRYHWQSRSDIRRVFHEVCPYGKPGSVLAVCDESGKPTGTRIKIISVGVAQIQSTDDFDAVNNGVEGYAVDGVLNGVPGEYITGRPENEFKDIWEARYPGSWERNDWVWVIDFERVVPETAQSHKRWLSLPVVETPPEDSCGMVFAFDEHLFDGVEGYLEYCANSGFGITDGEPTWATPLTLSPPDLYDLWHDQGNDEVDPPVWLEALQIHINQEFEKPSGLWEDGNSRPLLPDVNPYVQEGVV
jgi:hypothetical protein